MDHFCSVDAFSTPTFPSLLDVILSTIGLIWLFVDIDIISSSYLTGRKVCRNWSTNASHIHCLCTVFEA